MEYIGRTTSGYCAVTSSFLLIGVNVNPFDSVLIPSIEHRLDPIPRSVRPRS